MKIEPSSVEGVYLTGPDAPGFVPAIEALMGRPVGAELRPALPFSVLAHNTTPRTVALLGVRFDMLGRNARAYSVVHYADTLRHPERADLKPGAARFVCAEPVFTDLVLRKRDEAGERARMNLENLRKVMGIRASVDCVAFADGEFQGRDSLGAFARLEKERAAESDFVDEVLLQENGFEEFLDRALNVLARRAMAKRFRDGLERGGLPEVMARAREHRCRMRLWR